MGVSIWTYVPAMSHSDPKTKPKIVGAKMPSTIKKGSKGNASILKVLTNIFLHSPVLLYCSAAFCAKTFPTDPVIRLIGRLTIRFP